MKKYEKYEKKYEKKYENMRRVNGTLNKLVCKKPEE